MFFFWKKFLRFLRARKSFPTSWERILEKQIAFYQDYSESEKIKFKYYLKLFIWEKHFLSAGEMTITDEVKVVVAACAIRLILHLDLNHYNHLNEIIVYPYHFRHPDDEGIVFGEANQWGSVVLSWPAVLNGLKNSHDAHDTALHEFAHVLDLADGHFDGTPLLKDFRAYGPYARVLSHHFLSMRSSKNHCRKELLRSYAKKNEAEFFAVATEVYFEKDEQMKEQAPELYQELKDFYG